MSEPQRLGDTDAFRALTALIADHGVTQCPHCGQPHNVWGCASTGVAWPTQCACCESIMEWVEAA